MTQYQIKYGIVEILTDTVALIKGDAHITVDAAVYKELIDLLREHYPGGVKVIVDKRNVYSISVEALEAASKEPFFKALAFIAHGDVNKMSAQLEQVILEKSIVKIFTPEQGKEEALKWLESLD